MYKINEIFSIPKKQIIFFTVNDGSGLVDNVADSADESEEDEWNYFKGDQNDETNSQPDQEVTTFINLNSTK